MIKAPKFYISTVPTEIQATCIVSHFPASLKKQKEMGKTNFINISCNPVYKNYYDFNLYLILNKLFCSLFFILSL